MQTTYSNSFSWKEIFWFKFYRFVPMDPIDSMGSGNGMMPSPEPMLTQICLHMVPLEHNELRLLCTCFRCMKASIILCSMPQIIYQSWNENNLKHQFLFNHLHSVIHHKNSQNITDTKGHCIYWQCTPRHWLWPRNFFKDWLKTQQYWFHEYVTHSYKRRIQCEYLVLIVSEFSMQM